MAGQTPTPFISRLVWFEQKSKKPFFRPQKVVLCFLFFRGKSFKDVVTRRGNCFFVSVLGFRPYLFFLKIFT